MKGLTIITGTIGSDIHCIGIKIIENALRNAGFKVVSMGILTKDEDFAESAFKTKADAIFVSSLYGQAELDAQNLRNLCDKRGLKDIILYIGGNLSLNEKDWSKIEKKFINMGFDRVFPPDVKISDVIETLKSDLNLKERSNK